MKPKKPSVITSDPASDNSGQTSHIPARPSHENKIDQRRLEAGFNDRTKELFNGKVPKSDVRSGTKTKRICQSGSSKQDCNPIKTNVPKAKLSSKQAKNQLKANPDTIPSQVEAAQQNLEENQDKSEEVRVLGRNSIPFLTWENVTKTVQRIGRQPLLHSELSTTNESAVQPQAAHEDHTSVFQSLAQLASEVQPKPRASYSKADPGEVCPGARHVKQTGEIKSPVQEVSSHVAQECRASMPDRKAEASIASRRPPRPQVSKGQNATLASRDQARPSYTRQQQIVQSRQEAVSAPPTSRAPINPSNPMGLPQDDPRPRVTMSFLEFNEALERSKAHFLNQQFPTSVHSPFSAQAQGLQQMNWTRRFPEFPQSGHVPAARAPPPQSGHVPAARAPPSQFSMPLSQVSIQLIKTTFVYHFSIYFIPVVRQKYTMAKITRSHL